MGVETRLFKSEERRSRQEVAAFLHALADKIDAGEVILGQGRNEVTLALPPQLILEVQVEDEEKGVKGTQHSLEVELKWSDDMAESGPLELR